MRVNDIWVAAALVSRTPTFVYGAWYCPELQTGGLALTNRAVDAMDALRAGCAIAILDAADTLGEALRVHLPKSPAPKWLVDKGEPSPLTYTSARLIYSMRMDAWADNFVIADDRSYDEELKKIMEEGGVWGVPCGPSVL